MLWRVEINTKRGVFDCRQDDTLRAIKEVGLNSVKSVKVTQIYNIDGDLTEENIHRVARELLSDPITQEFVIKATNQLVSPPQKKDYHTIEIAYNPGVMDPVEQSTIKGIKDLGFQAGRVSTAKQYILHGELSYKQVDLIVEKVLANKLIQHVAEWSGKHSEENLDDDLTLVIADFENS